MAHTASPPSTALRIESSPRWVRGFVDGQAIVNSKRVRVVYGERRGLLYYFPLEDVRTDLLREGRVEDGVRFWALELDGHSVEDIAWTHAHDGPRFEALRDMIAFEWRKVDTWYEEDEEVFFYPRDPYHRVDVFDSSRHVRVVLDGEVIADTRRPRLLFETGLPTRYYIPRMDVRLDLLEASETTTHCPYKGTAGYYSVRQGGKVHRDVVWYYPFPLAECPKIANLLAFYSEKVDVYVDGELQAVQGR